MFRTRIAWMFLGSLTLLAGRAAIADDTPATGEKGGQNYGGATYDDAGKVEDQKTMSPDESKISPDNKASELESPAPAVTPAPTIERDTAIVTPPVMAVEPVEDDEDDRLMTPFGLSLSVGGGVAGFTDESMDDLTNVGGAWDARLTIGSRLPIALEAAYIGTAQEISALGLDDDATLVSNGIEGAVRLNLGTYAIQPFLFGGAAWQRFDLVGDDFNTSSVQSEDDVFAIPVGAGVAAKYRGFLVDARVSYREAFGNDLMNTPSADADDDDVELNSWAATARLGFEF
jgi:hypothetical protein